MCWFYGDFLCAAKAKHVSIAISKPGMASDDADIDR
jgi:hypothetical protein